MTAGEMVRLVPDVVREGSTRLLRVPRWVRPEEAEGYWHIPRSAEIADAGFSTRYDLDHVVIASLWCGQTRWTKYSNLRDKPFAGALLCGTCEGRAAGYERRDGLIFRPRSPFDPPKFCPALCSAAEKFCPFCGAKAAWRRNYCHYDQTQHRTGDRLLAVATPCPRHGWKHARRQSIGITCSDGWRNDCGFVIAKAPHGAEVKP